MTEGRARIHQLPGRIRGTNGRTLHHGIPPPCLEHMDGNSILRRRGRKWKGTTDEKGRCSNGETGSKKGTEAEAEGGEQRRLRHGCSVNLRGRRGSRSSDFAATVTPHRVTAAVALFSPLSRSPPPAGSYFLVFIQLSMYYSPYLALGFSFNNATGLHLEVSAALARTACCRLTADITYSYKHPRLSISNLLNAEPRPGRNPGDSPLSSSVPGSVPQLPSNGPSVHPIDIRPQLLRLSSFLNVNNTIEAPPAIQEKRESILEYLEAPQDLPASKNPSITPCIPDAFNTFAVNRSTNVKINRITTLEVLYEYPAGYILEYPETSSTGYIGHLFRMDPNEWHDPILNVAYSRGGRMGQTVSTAVVKCDILVDSTGKQVDCSERHTTCEGSKVCPNSNMDALSIPHAKATREDVRERLRKDREDRLQYVSPSRNIFLKTLAYITSIQKLGCSRPLFEATGSPTLRQSCRKRESCIYCKVNGDIA
ncbi:hypothetical protein K438DRAFT_1749804 [Mycena galopus ATCC 62051]|nr:hypothetical protein K438DRAFT_1749804 [Mycena galopus ATCC 62051]